MKKITFLFTAVLLFSLNGFTHLNGFKTIPEDYPTPALAIADLNAVGVVSSNNTHNKTKTLIYDYDAQATAVNAPVSSIFASTQDVKVSVKNLGTETMYEVVINWSVNGVVQAPFAHTLLTPLEQHNSITQVLIGSFNFTQVGFNTIQVWTGAINGNADQNTDNDTCSYELMVKGYAPIPYTENFDGTWLNEASTRCIPSFYSNNTPSDGNSSWRRNDDGVSASWSSSTFGSFTPTGANNTTNSARFHSVYTNSGTIGIIDHYLDFSTPGVKELSFFYINTSGTDSLETYISYNNGISFNKLAGFTVQSTWNEKHFNLSDYTNTEVIIRLKATSDHGSTDIGVDEFKVRIIPTSDVKVTKIQGPVNSLCGLVSDTVRVTIVNLGLTDAYDVPLTLDVEGPSGTNTYQSVIPSILVGQSTVVNAAIINTTDGGTYNFTAYTELLMDGDNTNDTLRKIITTPIVNPIPYIENFEGITLNWNFTGTPMAWGISHDLTSKALFKNMFSAVTSANFFSPKIGPINTGYFMVFDYKIVDYAFPFPGTNITISDSIKVVVKTCDESLLLYAITSTNHITSNSMKRVVLPLDAMSGEDIFAGFILQWGAGDYYVDIDNFEIKMADPISVDVSDAMICLGQTHTFIATEGDGYTYQWFEGSLTNPLTETTNELDVEIAGDYYVIATNIFGLSDTAMATLSVYTLPTDADLITGTLTVCQGQNAVNYSVPVIASATSYVWTLPDGATGTSFTNNISVDYGISAVSGDITVKGNNICGDGEISTIAITVKQSSASSIAEIACDSYNAPDGTVYTASGIITAVIPNAAGCDSTITIDLSINHSTLSSETHTACDSYTWNGTEHTTSGVYTFISTNAAGCDSTASLYLTINATPTTPVITLNGNVLSSDAPAGNQWYDENGLISDAVNQEYTAIIDANYYTIVTLLDCNSNPSNTIILIGTDVEIVDLNKTTNIYPNPFSNELIIEIEGSNEIQNFEILNSIGQVILQGNFVGNTTIQTSSFTPGNYIVILENGKTFEFIKILKE